MLSGGQSGEGEALPAATGPDETGAGDGENWGAPARARPRGGSRFSPAPVTRPRRGITTPVQPEPGMSGGSSTCKKCRAAPAARPCQLDPRLRGSPSTSPHRGELQPDRQGPRSQLARARIVTRMGGDRASYRTMHGCDMTGSERRAGRPPRRDERASWLRSRPLADGTRAVPRLRRGRAQTSPTCARKCLLPNHHYMRLSEYIKVSAPEKEVRSRSIKSHLLTV